MILTDKQLDKWIKWFMETYEKDCTKDENGKRSIPIIYSENPWKTELEHREMRRKKLKKLMGRCYNNLYVHRGGKEDTRGEAQLKALWLYNGPIFKSLKEKPGNSQKLSYQIKDIMRRLIKKVKEMLGIMN